jgi:phosphopantothenoylcysteine synthetase/decarboxylase
VPRFLVTAGNTREMIDRVRDWGNVFTGNTGYSVARALAGAGDVDLLTSNRTHLAEARALSPRITASSFSSHATLESALAALMKTGNYDGVFMTAAVADYAPAGVYEVVERRREGDGEVWRVRDVSAGKVKSTYREMAVLGTRTRKLVDLFRTEWAYRGLLVKFKLEVGISRDDLVRVGQASRKASGADYLVANTLDMVEGDAAGAFLLGDGTKEWVPRAELPQRLMRLAAEWLSSHSAGSNAGASRA